MQENQVSVTAIMSAFIRAYHTMNADPKIFNDFLAYHLLTEEERTNIERNLSSTEAVQFFDPESAASCTDRTSTLSAVMRAISTSILVSRARYTEDCLAKAVKEGVQQYIILGAGMDTFAFRQPELLKELQVFEVDHPATQASKLRRLADLGWKHPEQLHFVPVDFMKDSLATALQNSGYDPQKLSLFSWLGVTYYLSQHVIFDTLRNISDIAPVGSTIIFDYLDNNAFLPDRSPKRVQLMQEAARRSGEPMKAGFDPFTLSANLESLGLRLQENLSPSDIEKLYFCGRSDGYHAFENAHFARTVVA